MNPPEMKLIEIDSLGAPELEVYGMLTEAQLRNRLEPAKGLFIAESPKVIHVALDAGMTPVSLLCERRHIEGDARSIIERLPGDVPVYTGSRELLAQLTGYTLTRGVLCAMHRPAPLPPEDVCRDARRIVVLHGIVDTTNVGAIFRSAAALGMDAVLMTRDSCDPLNRRAVRVSMGSVFLVPWTWLDAGDGTSAGTIRKLKEMGFTTAAMALHKDNICIDDPKLKAIDHLALIMGNEGDGLPEIVIDASDHVVKIPMHHGVDSLNVGNAAAIAFWELGGSSTCRTSDSPIRSLGRVVP